jgi:hypothetical protein
MKKMTLNELKSLEFFKHYNRNGVDFIRTNGDTVQIIELFNKSKAGQFLDMMDYISISIDRNNKQFLRYINDENERCYCQYLQ